MLPRARHPWILAFLSLLPIAFGCRVVPEAEEELVVRRGGDLVAIGPELILSDSVPGDAMLAAGVIDFVGWTGGDYLGAGGDQKIGGRVGGSVRAAGGQVRLDAQVGRNATLAGGNVELGDASAIEGNAYLAGGRVSVEGSVGHLLRVGAGEVVLDGISGGDVRVEAGRLRVGPRAQIAGDLRYRVTEEVVIDPAAQVEGEVIALPPPPERPRGRGLALLRALWALGFLVVGAVAVSLFPGTSGSAEEAVRTRPWASLGFGLLWLLAVPIAVVVVAFTLVGLPLALVSAAVYLIFLYLGRAVIALWLGRLALRKRGALDRGGWILCFLVGGAVLVLLRFVPYVGGLVTLLATVVGVGALIAALATRAAPAPRAP